MKFLCGTIERDLAPPDDPTQIFDPLVPGTYRTAIDVTTATSVGGLRLSIAEARPFGDTSPQPEQFVLGVLEEGHAVEVDCGQIARILYPPDLPGPFPPPFLKGFVRLFHPGGQGPGFEGARARSVHVVAIYTGEPTAAPAP